ncbi:choice-of-anchor I family protein [Spongiibacter nanhainus]|uniref:Choice-of-anchor I family protein n=1 Tax=Spongiibacter nanhainus TaxID=2794344 RepID=A0A7T4R1X8_9GAMM|nr:choice-of-anchor I family protein [Spongiibacter nanhainus]QQD18839.1 choice-of-anchor I family protein [Spongiibacter nanhainus]
MKQPSVILVGAITAGALFLSACSGDSNSSRRTKFELNPRQFYVDESLGSVSFANGPTLDLTLAVGSGAFRSANDRPGPRADEGDIFYTITDRGPTIPCEDSAEVLGVPGFCSAPGSIFAIPDFNPQIIQWQISGVGTELTLSKMASIPLVGSNGQPLNGLPNPYNNATSETAFDHSGNQMSQDANGIDPEALVQLDNGRFWVAEEYGPSLMLVDSDGRVLRRHMPNGSTSSFAGVSYPVSDDLIPGIFAKRQLHRGFEALAVSPDNTSLYAVMQSPLANPAVADFEAGRIVRILKFSLNAETGDIVDIDGEYLYRLDTPSQFGTLFDGAGDVENGEFLSQSDITVNEAVAIGEDYLAVVEQARNVSKVYRINLANAVNILGSQWDSQFGGGETLEQQYLVDGVPFVPKQLGFDSLSKTLPLNIDPLGERIEGLALLDANFAAVTNDNNYGIGGERSRIAILPLGPLIIANAAPVTPSVDYNNSASFIRNDTVFGSGAAKVVAADTSNSRLFVVNAQRASVDVVDVTDPQLPVQNGELDIAAAGSSLGITPGAVTHAVVGLQYVAVTVENSNPQSSGFVAFYDLDDLSLVDAFTVGAGPNMAVFDQISTTLLVANEGQPSDDYSVDPEGSVTVINFSDGIASATVSTIDFADFNVGASRAAELPAGVRIYGPGATVAEDLEPETISVGLDNNTVFVGLQENNAVAVLDLGELSVERIVALGTKDFGRKGNELDVNDDGVVDLKTWPGVAGMYQPDGIGAYQYQGDNYFVTANEGEARDYSGFSEQQRAFELDGVNGPDIDNNNPSASDAADNNALGRLTVSNQSGDSDGDNDIDVITAFGGRSFAIWDEQGNLIYDSGSDIARVTEAQLGFNFNDVDTASDEKGAEPEGLSLVASLGRVYAFITLERAGGLMIYDVSNPYGVQFVQYVNNRDFTAQDSGDVGPEGIAGFTIDGQGYIAVGNEQSGNVRIFELDAGNSTTQ